MKVKMDDVQELEGNGRQGMMDGPVDVQEAYKEQEVPDKESETSLKAAAEALIFASREPFVEKHFTAAVGKQGKGRLAELVRQLNMEYERDNRAFEILHVGGGYQFFTRRDFAGVIRKLNVEKARTRLSRAALETLAIVAHRGPVIRSEIDAVRGVDSGGVLRTLLERRLINITGRAEIPGRPLLYETTSEFLCYFGLSDLSDLPKESELIREWGSSASIDEQPSVDSGLQIEDGGSTVLSEKENGNRHRTMEVPGDESKKDEDS